MISKLQSSKWDVSYDLLIVREKGGKGRGEKDGTENKGNKNKKEPGEKERKYAKKRRNEPARTTCWKEEKAKQTWVQKSTGRKEGSQEKRKAAGKERT